MNYNDARQPHQSWWLGEKHPIYDLTLSYFIQILFQSVNYECLPKQIPISKKIRYPPNITQSRVSARGGGAEAKLEDTKEQPNGQ